MIKRQSIYALGVTQVTLNSAQTIIGTTLKPTIVLDNKKNLYKNWCISIYTLLAIATFFTLVNPLEVKKTFLSLIHFVNVQLLCYLNIIKF